MTHPLMTEEAIEQAKQKPREDLAGALQSVDNLTNLLTMMCEKTHRRAIASNVTFKNGQISIFVTADNTTDEVKLGVAISEAVASTVESIFGVALEKRDAEIAELKAQIAAASGG